MNTQQYHVPVLVFFMVSFVSLESRGRRETTNCRMAMLSGSVLEFLGYLTGRLAACLRRTGDVGSNRVSWKYKLRCTTYYINEFY